MKDNNKSPADGNLEDEVWNAISAFEQILEAIPNDRASLEALWNAFEQIGDYTKAKSYLLRLGDVLVEEADTQAAIDVLDKVRTYASDDDQARELVAKIEKLCADMPTERSLGTEVEEMDMVERKPSAQSAQPQPAADRVRNTFSMADELSFAWSLLEAKQLTEEEYASIVADLTEMSAMETVSTVSVLHVLETRAFRNLEKILGYVAKECGTPLVALSSFDVKPDEIRLLPPEFMMGRGAFVFETLGPKTVLAVVMNPYDKQLRKDVEALTGRKCYYYLCMPSEFDKALAAMLGGGDKKK